MCIRDRPLCGKEITVDADNFFNAISNRIQNAQVVEQGNIYHGTDIDVEVATVQMCIRDRLISEHKECGCICDGV